MRAVHSVVGAAVTVQAVLGVLLVGAGRVPPVAALAGVATVAVGGLLLARAVRRRGTVLGPADLVTVVRLVLVGVVTALVVQPLGSGDAAVPAASVVALLAIVLDGVDGRVARRTGTASELGARFDMETDAFLILVLSAAVAAQVGMWVLLVGLARYLFVAASWALPWLRATTPPRYWCKVVAVVAGVVLAVIASGALPVPLSVLLAALVLALIAESFGRDVVWLLRHCDGRVPTPLGRRPAAAVGGLTTAGAAALVMGALLVPDDVGSPWLALPLEAVLLAAVLALAGPRTGRAVAGAAGAVLGAVALLKLLDLGFTAALGRPFQPLSDWTYLGSVPALLADGAGEARARVLVVLGVVGAVGLLLLMPVSARRLARVVQRDRRRTLTAATALGVVWMLASVTGLHAAGGAPIASASATSVLARDLQQTVAALSDERDFVEAAAQDPWAGVPRGRLLARMRGKDVLVVFVESYGRTALEDQAGSAALRAQLDSGSASLAAAGWTARSGWLTSPTFAGISWLAHATLQSGTWVDTQRRYDALLATRRLTLASAFATAGWRTVADVPSNEKPWPEGQAFYGYEQVYDEHSTGYAGPRLGYAAMPDQYTLDAFRRWELDPGHRPVMAEIDLVSSHAPWTPLPRVVPWDALGDGSVFRGTTGPSAAELWSDPVRVRTAYEQSISYSMDVLVSFLSRLRSRDLVVLVVGDHQPASIVSGAGAGHDVPVTLLSGDADLVRAADGWGWRPGLRPDASTPVWRMDQVRDRLLAAWSS